jgi:formylglycine-generating enzyme required for sulfatase activity/tRNA A-37 threonylcarbamoyl transferase component Bud32
MAKIKCPSCSTVNPEWRADCLQCGGPLPRVRVQGAQPQPQGQAAPVQFRRNQVLANRYTILDLIGRGGMGCIYRVKDNVLGEEVALKTLLPQFVRDRMVVERFFNEAKIARRLAHPHIVRVHDIGSNSGIVYISMELLQGHSLRSVLEKQGPDGRLPLLETLRIFDELCAALEYAHRYTVHRDIKPENVMVETSGNVKLMDFGISKLMADAHLTGASIVMGTPFYMSPEQLRNSRDVTARADIFSMGVMLYEMLTGNVPTGVPKPASQLGETIPTALDEIIARCVDPNPENRYESATELRAALRGVYEELTGEKPRRTTGGNYKTVGYSGESAWNLSRVAGVVLALGLLAGTAVGLFGAEKHRKRLLEAAPAAPATSTGAGDVAALAAAVEKAQTAAARHVEGNPERKDVLAQADALQARAQALPTEDPQVAELLEQALLHYRAIPVNPEGMVLVTGGHALVRGQPVYVPPFFIDRTEVTIRDYMAFCEREQWPMPFEVPQGTDLSLPMTMITWYDAQAYAASAGKQLPTEAQWLRAAYGDTAGPYPWGIEPNLEAANTAEDTEVDGPAPVGTFPEDISPFGVLDMGGNVSEWVRGEEEVGFGGEVAAVGSSMMSTAPGAVSMHTPADRQPVVGMRAVRLP